MMKILLRIVKPILKIVIILCLYQIACMANDKVIINDLIYIRLIHSVKQVSGENLKYEKCYFYKGENDNPVFKIYFYDCTRGKTEYKTTLLELRALQVEFEKFLENNPNYFPEGCKIEIWTGSSLKTASLFNFVGDTIYDEFVNLHILQAYDFENVAECFPDIRYLYYCDKVENAEICKKFSQLEILGIGYGFRESEIEEIKSLCPNLEITHEPIK